MNPRGIDVSHFQGKINWEQAYLDLLITYDENGNLLPVPIRPFVVVKISQGTNFPDPMDEQNLQGAKAAGFIILGYHFFDPTKDPVAQAMFFLAQLSALNFPMGIAIDVEQTPGWDVLSAEIISEKIQDWLDYVQEHTVGGELIVYTGPAFIAQYLTAFPMGAYKLWLADYANVVPVGLGNYQIWQYSETGALAGINGKEDLDIFNGDTAVLQGLLMTGLKTV
jgi:lysozyme